MMSFRKVNYLVRKHHPSIIAALVLVSLLTVSACGANTEIQPSEPASQSSQTNTEASQLPTRGVVEVVSQDAGGSGYYKFDPSDFKFKIGESVTFSMTAETEFHTFTVDELGIDESVDAGDSVTFTYTFDIAGTCKLICIPHEALGMVGQIVVE